MKPRDRGETGEQDLFRSRLDQIIDMNHALVSWRERSIGGSWSSASARVYEDGPGRPPLPTRLMAGLAILKALLRSLR